MRAFEPFNKRYRWNHPEDMKTISVLTIYAEVEE